MNRWHVNSFLLCAFLSLGLSCGQQQALELNQFGDYVKAFEEKSFEMGKPVLVTNLIVRFGHLGLGSTSAQCSTGGGGAPTVTIDPDRWITYTDTQRMMLMMHELGHCVLGRFHREDIFGNGDPVSLMNPYLFDEHVYLGAESHYLHELFHAN